MSNRRSKMAQVIMTFFLATIFFTAFSIPQAIAKEIKVGVLMPLAGYIAFLGDMQEVTLRVAQKEFAKMGPASGFNIKFICDFFL
jgi:ABC-type branched-subunit amino acid transport system substrate-binding protein